MKFAIKNPCELCPFRRDVAPFLQRRARLIATQLADDHFWFACHETTGVKGGRRKNQREQSHCMGVMRVLWREGNPNIAMRLALATSTITVDDLERASPACFRSLTAFVKHHEQEKRR